MASTWTEPQVDASEEATITTLGRTKALRAPETWPEGSRVRLLLLPPHNGAAQKPPLIQSKTT